MPVKNQNKLLRYALRYSRLHWHIFPIQPKQKTPLINGWRKRATDDPKIIRRWWETWPDANIGVATGPCSGFFVLDIDSHNYGDWALASLEESYDKLPTSVKSYTGNGGYHMIFTYPNEQVNNSVGRLGAGLDIRGDGGYIVLPPSIHPTGSIYRWIFPPWKEKIAIPPEWLIKLISTQKKNKIEDIPDIFDADEENGMLWVRRALKRVEKNAGRNESAFWLACQLRDTGFSKRHAWGFMRIYCRLVPKRDHSFTLEEGKRAVINAFGCGYKRSQAVKVDNYAT